MADHVAAVLSQLLAHAGTAALVGDRVWHSALPQEEKGKPYMPAIVIQQISGVAEHVMGGTAGIVDLRIQIDVWAKNRPDCQAVTEADEGRAAELQRHARRRDPDVRGHLRGCARVGSGSEAMALDTGLRAMGERVIWPK